MAGHIFQMGNAYNDTMPAFFSERVDTIVTGWVGGQSVFEVQFLVHIDFFHQQQRRATNALELVLGGHSFASAVRGRERHRNEYPCRSPATIVSLRPETLRPYFSVRLPSTVHITLIQAA